MNALIFLGDKTILSLLSAKIDDRFIPPWLILPGKRARVRVNVVVFVDEEKLHSFLWNFGMYVTGVEFTRVEYT